MPDGHMSQPASKRLLWIALGRQRVGKTALLNAAVQYFRALGSNIEVWNADQQNRTHSLSTFYSDAAVPPEGGLADSRVWIERRFVDQAQRGYHAVLDAGGGATGFSSLIEDVPVLEPLKDLGTEVIGLFCVGPEQADLDYLEHFATSGTFLPDKTVIVLNAGLVLSGRSSNGAFAPIMTSPAVRAATERGAEVITFPALGCMSEVTDRGLSFAEAAAGLVKPGQQPMSLFDPARVREWWTKKIPDFFGQFPPDWLPLETQPSVAPSGAGDRP